MWSKLVSLPCLGCGSAELNLAVGGGESGPFSCEFFALFYFLLVFSELSLCEFRLSRGFGAVFLQCVVALVDVGLCMRVWVAAKNKVG